MKSITPVRALFLLTILATVFIGLAVAEPEALAPSPLIAMGALIANPHGIPDPVLKVFRKARETVKRNLLVTIGLAIIVFALVYPPALMGLPLVAFGLVSSVDMHGELTLSLLSDIAARTSTVTGSAVDIRDYVGRIKVLQLVGTVSGTSPTLNGKIQDSADGSTGWADVTGATFTEVTASNSSQSIGVDTRACKRYIRYVGTIAGTSPSFMVGASFVGKKQTA